MQPAVLQRFAGPALRYLGLQSGGFASIYRGKSANIGPQYHFGEDYDQVKIEWTSADDDTPDHILLRSCCLAAADPQLLMSAAEAGRSSQSPRLARAARFGTTYAPSPGVAPRLTTARAQRTGAIPSIYCKRYRYGRVVSVPSAG